MWGPLVVDGYDCYMWVLSTRGKRMAHGFFLGEQLLELMRSQVADLVPT